ncbi:MAG TPA: hypothetical protein VGN72_03350 [Tepidisphaeraceae bacterium]|jgi:hypothetical protein|nr:hypothetical protein [Tepidisphaeraceae bacterium]
MVSTIWPPRRDANFSEYVQQYSAQITANPTSLGLTAPIAATLAGLVSSFQTALAASTSGLTRGPSTVFAKNEARRNLEDYVRLTARQIQGMSTVSDQQRKDLKLPVRGEGSPALPPGSPESFKAELGADGSLQLKWKCANRGAGGTMYQVWRRVGATGPVEYCGGVGQKSFVDATLPPGTSTVMYQVQAVRSTAVGPFSQFNVNFAIGGGSATVSAVQQSPKLAA